MSAALRDSRIAVIRVNVTAATDLQTPREFGQVIIRTVAGQPIRIADVARVEQLMLARHEARASKDFARSDSLRQEITDLGVSVRDTPEGQVWDLE